MTRKPFLDYYGEKQIIPVGQDLTDIARHFRRRAGLYRSLGLVPAWMRGKRIIEFGPGTGDNAIYTASLQPDLYTVVDGNPSSIDALKDKEANGFLNNVEITHSDITDYADKRRYDLVLCEAVIPGQINPAAFLRHVAQFADSGGVVVATSIDAISTLPENCRRLVKPVLKKRTTNDQELLSETVSLIEPHLKTLSGMSRHFEDWALDVVLHPHASFDFFFSIPDAIESIADEFEIHGTSPQFLVDWRWYKSIHEEDTGRNSSAIKRYTDLSHAFLDYRYDPTTTGTCDNAALLENCMRAAELHYRIWEADDVEGIPEFLEIIDEIAKCVVAEMPRTASSLRDYILGMQQLIDGEENPNFGDFCSHFGRGMQYISFVRRQ